MDLRLHKSMLSSCRSAAAAKLCSAYLQLFMHPRLGLSWVQVAAQLEGGCELGRVWIHVDMGAFFAACEERGWCAAGTAVYTFMCWAFRRLV